MDGKLAGMEKPFTEDVRGFYQENYKSRKFIEDSPSKSRHQAQKTIGKFARAIPKGNGVYLGIAAGKGALEGPIYQSSLKHLKAVILSDIAMRRPLIGISTMKRHAQRWPNVLNIVSDAHKIPLKNNSVDLISCHMAQDFFYDRSKSTGEMFRVLKPDGNAVVYLHHPEMIKLSLDYKKKSLRLSKRAQFVADFWQRLLEEKRVFSSVEQIREHYAAHGFEVNKVEAHREPTGDAWWEVILHKPN
jgi:ubiquinone/menaquinone biosynthesis C-methylase UbiE